MKRIELIILLVFSNIFAFYNQDSRMIALSGAYTTIASGYKCVGVNPANLVDSDNVSINLFNINSNMLNNFFTLTRYNQINGADLENENAPKYFAKDKILDYLNGDNIEFNAIGSFPIPMINISSNNMSFNSGVTMYSDYEISPDLIDILLNGNELNRYYDLSMFQDTFIIWETSFSKAYELSPISVGFSIKYLHGLGNYRLEPIQDTTYFLTDMIDVSAKAEYLLKQNMKGNGFSFDFGFITNEFNGWKFGASIINIGGKIKWNKDMFVDQYLEDVYKSYPFRENEHHHISLSIADLNLSSLNDPNITTDSLFQVISQNVVESDTIISGFDYIESSENDFYYIPSDSLPDNYFNSSNAKIVNTDYPTKLNIGFSKKIDLQKLVVCDISVGFDNSFMNKQKWRFALGYEFGSQKFPLRCGFSYGGYDGKSIGVGFGYNFGGYSMDFGLNYKGSYSYGSSTGYDIGLDFYWMKI